VIYQKKLAGRITKIVETSRMDSSELPFWTKSHHAASVYSRCLWKH